MKWYFSKAHKKIIVNSDSCQVNEIASSKDFYILVNIL